MLGRFHLLGAFDIWSRELRTNNLWMATHPPRPHFASLVVLDTMVHRMADWPQLRPKLFTLPFLTFPCTQPSLSNTYQDHQKYTPYTQQLRILRHILLLSPMWTINRVGLSSSRYPRYQSNCPCQPQLPIFRTQSCVEKGRCQLGAVKAVKMTRLLL